jgi:hypothetical protein
MSSKPTDKDLYEKVKKKVYSQYKVHSAYRSGQLVKQYKEAFEKKHGDKKKPYTGTKKKDEGISRWMREKWRSDTGKKVYTSKSSVFRPTKKITRDTPTTFKELSKKEIERAKREKAKKGRVSKF